ncbi:MAG: TRAP transporter small permease [Gammaproteobacteria bacterium]|jgi:TRAP-type C4-dicarboxylate transport system permease small subunit|nr:TRAP transporter small permease [Gammaproteobacteria bacterium]NCW09573.1 TRAP transporter small permease [Gammaproteobacteria bacterium]NCW74680.1 TRAP transporter small permease [Gammaproteobacteria bacterium]NCX48370.1 TRAP transporter small permease [Gammaproteobacteria bacterium]
MRGYISLVNKLSQVIGVLAALMVVIAVIITCQMIFIRYFLNGSTYWHTEAVVYLILAATLLGLPYVQKLKGHVNVDLVPMLLPPTGRKALMITSFVSAISVLLVMTYFSAELVYLSYSKGWTSDTVWGPPLWIPYLTMPLGFGLFALQLVADLLETWATPAEDIVVEGGSH